MTDQRCLELVSAAIDGELDIDERAELDMLLESSEEAREFRTELEQLDSLLKDVPDLEPPESLLADIVANVKPKPVQSEPSILDWLRPLVPGTGLRYVMAVAAGAIFAAVFIENQSVLSDTADFADLVGTMAPNVSSTDAGIIESFTFSEDGFESLVQLRYSGDALLLDVYAETAVPLDIAIDVGDTGLRPYAVAQIEGGSESIAISGQALQIKTLGKQRLTILLRRVDDAALAEKANIRLEFSTEGKFLQRGALTATLKGVG